MIERKKYLDAVLKGLGRAPVTALMGPRQCGKTTLAREIAANRRASTFLDVEARETRGLLQNAGLYLAAQRGLVVVDEVQQMPELFSVLRVLADRKPSPARFLILGSAAPDLIRHASESLAGRVEFVEMAGFTAEECGPEALETLWLRGGLPRSFLARSAADSMAWRENFIQTFLQRDIPQFGLRIAAPALRRFWEMLAHYHGQTFNASELGRALGVSDQTVKSYLDVLTQTFMVRQLQPWFENIGKRQVKAPKVYFRDSGLLHGLLALPTRDALWAHPRAGASWEGFMLEQVLRLAAPASAYFWSTHGGAELDLLLPIEGRRHGVEFKWQEAPAVTKSMRMALADLRLDHLWVVHPGSSTFPLDEKITAVPAAGLPAWAAKLNKPHRRARR